MLLYLLLGSQWGVYLHADGERLWWNGIQRWIVNHNLQWTEYEWIVEKKLFMIILLFNNPHKPKYSKELKNDDRSHMLTNQTKPSQIKRHEHLLNSAIQRRTLTDKTPQRSRDAAYPAFINFSTGESTIQYQWSYCVKKITPVFKDHLDFLYSISLTIKLWF